VDGTDVETGSLQRHRRDTVGLDAEAAET